MTTIAYSKSYKYMAGDKLCSFAGMPTTVVKIFQLYKNVEYAMIGGSGGYEDVLAIRDWLEHGGEKPTGLEDFSSLLISRDNRIYRMDSKLVPMEILEDFYAIGCGRDFAIASMHYGHSPQDAVTLASNYDIHTGRGIDIIHLVPVPYTDVRKWPMIPPKSKLEVDDDIPF